MARRKRRNHSPTFKAHLGAYFHKYNTRRPHQSLDGQTPDAIYFNNLPQEKLAA